MTGMPAGCPGAVPTDPYAVWVSEVMLQQTRVETVIPYYLRWMERFPDIPSLAAAGEQDVLAAWEGLGYYARARNLWRAARRLVESGSTRLPEDPRELEKLPGVGRYTAGAIASIAFGVDAPALDGNIKRILARVYDLDLPVDRPEGVKRLWELAAGVLTPGRAGDHNQALMDLGSLICLARDPKCGDCPLESICLAKSEWNPERTTRCAVRARPSRISGSRGSDPAQGSGVDRAAAVARVCWAGCGNSPAASSRRARRCPKRWCGRYHEELGTAIEVGEPLGVYEHAYTHFKVTLTAFHCRLTGGEPQALEASELAWVKPEALGDYPMGNIDRRISQDLVN